MEEVKEKALLSVKDLRLGGTITTFSGKRATGHTGDFIIGEVEDAKWFFNCAAIESPGLTAVLRTQLMSRSLLEII